MKEALKVIGAVIVTVSLVAAVVIYVGYQRSHQGGSEGDALRTDREYYMQGEPVVFILKNVWDHPIEYDSDLRDTLSIYDSAGKAVVILPRIQGLSFITLEPNETIQWEWNQTFYLYKVVNGRTDWDPRSSTQVPSGTYKARVEFGDISATVSFRVLP